MATNFPKTVFCGGIMANNQVSREVVQFDGRRWRSLPSMNTARCGAAAVFFKGKATYLLWLDLVVLESL